MRNDLLTSEQMQSIRERAELYDPYSPDDPGFLHDDVVHLLTVVDAIAEYYNQLTYDYNDLMHARGIHAVGTE